LVDHFFVTLRERGEEKVPGGTVRIVPAWRWALEVAKG
jgi:hypothetical protein